MMPDNDFIRLLEESLGKDAAAGVVAGLACEPQTSVRANPLKITLERLADHFSEFSPEKVPWSDEGLYLDSRPAFTTDPLFHAGAYYVQEASSMYVGRLVTDLLSSLPGESRTILDLCAAPGGKSTDILSAIGENDLLVSNEVIKARVTVLAENLARWGAPNVIVTNSDPAAFSPLENAFDLILTDVPCSGEGMFRKDDGARDEWSPDNVRLCAARQRRIVADVWPALRSGGYLIYSTCTFNHFEDEDNARWICSELGAELVSERHFLPGIDRGEGFYCALLAKSAAAEAVSRTLRTPCTWRETRATSAGAHSAVAPASAAAAVAKASGWIGEGCVLSSKGDMVKAVPARRAADIAFFQQSLRVIRSGVALATVKGRDLVPDADLAFSTILRPDAFPAAEVDLPTALRYLLGDPISLEDSPRGFVLVRHKGFPLGFVKNLGNRANNLYPAALRIRNRRLLQ